MIMPLSRLDYIGIGLFIAGSVLETLTEILRKKWKDQNPGKPYLQGFNRMVQHPNYLGFLLWRTGNTLLCGNYWLGLAVFIGNLLNFVFVAIPQLQKKNSDKYGPSYVQYSQKVARMIPYLY